MKCHYGTLITLFHYNNVVNGDSHRHGLASVRVHGRAVGATAQ